MKLFGEFSIWACCTLLIGVGLYLALTLIGAGAAFVTRLL